MKKSVSFPSPKTRGTKEDTAGSWCSICVEALKCGGCSTRFCQEAHKAKPPSEHLEEEVNRRQNAIAQMETERIGLLKTFKKTAEIDNRSSQGKWKRQFFFFFETGCRGRRDFGDGDGAARGREILEAGYDGVKKDRSQRAEED